MMLYFIDEKKFEQRNKRELELKVNKPIILPSFATARVVVVARTTAPKINFIVKIIVLDSLMTPQNNKVDTLLRAKRIWDVSYLDASVKGMQKGAIFFSSYCSSTVAPPRHVDVSSLCVGMRLIRFETQLKVKAPKLIIENDRIIIDM
jgi:hypothetical protein